MRQRSNHLDLEAIGSRFEQETSSNSEKPGSSPLERTRAFFMASGDPRFI
ncbi:MAG: hypothetical protein HN891_11995 [Planctomycetes bacterium]|nr:hypothetical protein [Planctomycetota bacterium]MBT6451491.1 hypothetical protein [Planctomycetota bacterium]MBT6542008.1 hypothetical protein [Planctomycetota bacterium]MBT6784072.1 hypothetical protein [Planctomycetota bacterium]MBT6969630.1 hypothetical protein [Planctomycetota bacterium]